MDLNDKVALITGARGIGRRVATALAGRGVDIALSYSRSRAKIESTLESVRAAGRRGAMFEVDLAAPAECRDLVGSVARVLGGIDILIHMASVYRERPLVDLSCEDWDGAMNVDLRAAFICAQSAAPIMKARGGGHIVTFSDWTAKSGRPRYPGFLPYYVAKSGVIALTEALALELAPDNILVNAIAPGPIVPQPSMSGEKHAAVERSTPLGRWGGEEEILKTVLALLDSEFVTGETIRVDGGRHVR
jgi:NAD(P)-dependent dehydrogenase (short-subunit alcohol dehydrogenase family)